MSAHPRIPGKRHHDPKMIGLWKIGRTIGKGSSGRVRIARHSKTGEYAAIKIVSKQTLFNSRLSMRDLGNEADRILQAIEREIVIMKLIDHPNIMRLYDVWETSTELYLILEYVEGGELFEYLCTKGALSKAEAVSHFQQIITAVDYCHRFNIAHRDLKPENLLLDKNKNIKVADFGMAVWQGKSDLLQTACGSPHYAAPEVIMGEAYNGTSSDVWSCGVILFALITGRLPFDDEDLASLLEKVKLAQFKFPPDMDPQARDLLSKMLEKDVKKRITIAEIIQHPFYNAFPPKHMAHDVPTLEQLARPLESVSDIDQDILRNLQTLWPGMADDRLIANLTNDQHTWDKAIYHLLVRYRDKHLENYDEDEEKAEKRRREKQEKKKKNQRDRLDDDIPPRTGPPTPSRAVRRVAFDVDSPSPSPSPRETGSYRKLSSIGSDIFAPTEDVFEEDFEEVRPPTPGYEEYEHDTPDVQEDKVQYFWNQVTEHLNFLNAAGRRRSQEKELPAAPSPPPLTLDLGTPFNVRKGTHEIFSPDATVNDFSNGRGTRPLSIRRRSDKENAEYLTADVQGPWPERKSSLRSNHTSATEGSSIRADRHIQIVEPTRSKLRKRRSILRPLASSTTDSPTLSAFSTRTDGSSYFFPSSPKRTWLGNIFHFGPATYQLLSTHDIGITRRECRRLLEHMGVSVMLIQTEGMGTLKCKLAETRDPAGAMATVKAVKFRVELKIPTTVQVIAGYTVAMNIVMEKGANSSFKLVYTRLRRDWCLDAAPADCVVESRASEQHMVEVQLDGPLHAI